MSHRPGRPAFSSLLVLAQLPVVADSCVACGRPGGRLGSLLEKASARRSSVSPKAKQQKPKRQSPQKQPPPRPPLDFLIELFESNSADDDSDVEAEAVEDASAEEEEEEAVALVAEERCVHQTSGRLAADDIGLSSKKMALITSDCNSMHSLCTKWP